MPVALDDAGDAVLLRWVEGPTDRPRIAASVRPRVGCFEDDVDLSPAGVRTGPPSLALHGDGTGYAAWADAAGVVHLRELTLTAAGRTGCPDQSKYLPKFPDATFAMAAPPKRMTRATLARRGVRLRIRVPAATRLSASLARKGRQLAASDLSAPEAGLHAITLKPRKRIRKRGRIEIWVSATRIGTPSHRVTVTRFLKVR